MAKKIELSFHCFYSLTMHIVGLEENRFCRVLNLIELIYRLRWFLTNLIRFLFELSVRVCGIQKSFWRYSYCIRGLYHARYRFTLCASLFASSFLRHWSIRSAFYSVQKANYTKVVRSYICLINFTNVITVGFLLLNAMRWWFIFLYD